MVSGTPSRFSLLDFYSLNFQYELVWMNIFGKSAICSLGLHCSKLMMSLVNISLKFQMFISEVCQYFC